MVRALYNKYFNSLSHASFLTGIIVLAFSLRLMVILANYSDHRFYHYQYGAQDTHVAIGDDYRYTEIALNLVQGNGFPVIFQSEPYDYDFRRPPGYLLLLAGVYKIFGFDVLFALLMNLVFSCWAIWYLYRIARSYFGETSARLAAFFWAIYPAAIWWNLSIYRENVSTFFILFAVWRFIRLTETFTWKNAVAFGAALGLGLLQESSFPVVLLFLSIGFALYAPVDPQPVDAKAWAVRKISELLKRLRYRFADKLILALIMFGSFAATLSPWLVYFYAKNGTLALSKGTAFGDHDNSYTFLLRRLAGANPEAHGSLSGYDQILKYRMEIVKKYVAPELATRLDSLSLAEQGQILNTLRANPDFMQDLNQTAKEKNEELLRVHPELYYGRPFGKLVAQRFLNYWLNFLPMHAPGKLVTISTLSTMGNRHSLPYYILGWSLLTVGVGLFFVYLYYAFRKGFVLFAIVSFCLVVLNTQTLSSETRYMLPYHTFIFMVLGYALTQWIEKRMDHAR